MFLRGCSTDEGPNDGGSVARRPWSAVHKACRGIAVIAPAIGTFERGVEHAGLDKVFTGGSAAATPVFQTAAMHRAIAQGTELVNHAVIPP